MKLYKIFILLLITSSCSQYSSRMVRVKTHKTENHAVNKRDAPTFSQINKVAPRDTKKEETTPFDIKPIYPSLPEQEKEKQASRRIHKHNNTINVEEAQNLGTNKAVPPSEDEIRQIYIKANKQSQWALGFLIGSLLLGILALIPAIVLSAIAINKYRKYKNPGVEEKYTLALTTLIISSLLLIAFISLMILLVVFLI